jgi:hypothetical protein
LLLLGNVGKDLDHHIPTLDQFPFEVVDLIKAHMVPFRRFVRIPHSVFVPQEIPGTVMDGDLSCRRQFFPELEEERTFLLLFRGLGSRIHPKAPGVQGMDHLVDQLAAPGGTEPLEQDDHRDPGIPDGSLQEPQAVFLVPDSFIIFFLGKLCFQVDHI